MLKNPWTILSSKTVYSTPWLDVIEHDVLNPKKAPAKYGTIHFKNVALGVVPIDQDGKIQLVGQWRFPLNQFSWELPEGGGRLDLPLQESAARELREETGYTARKWREILRLHLSNSTTDELSVVYLAQDLIPGQAEPEDSEVFSYKKVHYTEAFKMLEMGEFTDAITVAALLRLQVMHLKGELEI